MPGIREVQDPALPGRSARYDAYTSYRGQHDALTLFDVHSVLPPRNGADER